MFIKFNLTYVFPLSFDSNSGLLNPIKSISAIDAALKSFIESPIRTQLFFFSLFAKIILKILFSFISGDPLISENKKSIFRLLHINFSSLSSEADTMK